MEHLNRKTGISSGARTIKKGVQEKKNENGKVKSDLSGRKAFRPLPRAASSISIGYRRNRNFSFTSRDHFINGLVQRGIMTSPLLPPPLRLLSLGLVNFLSVASWASILGIFVHTAYIFITAVPQVFPPPPLGFPLSPITRMCLFIGTGARRVGRTTDFGCGDVGRWG